MQIEKVWAREVLDSRGNPTVEAEVTVKGHRITAIAPSGASTGTWEAHELRDGGERYGGKGVLKAVENIRTEIAGKITGMDPTDQRAIDEAMIEQIMNQLRKQFSVYSVQELKPERSIRRELVMFKVRAETPDIRNEVIQIANIFRASIIDVSLKSLTLALIGDETKADAMQKLLEAFGILELVRTGMVALERGAYTIGDETKEQTEFNLGKNFL